MNWLKEELQKRKIKGKDCYKALSVSHPKWKKIMNDPSLLKAIEINILASIMILTPKELFSLILFYKDVENGN